MYSPQPLDSFSVSNQSGYDNGFNCLSLRKLETLPRALLSVLLALLDPWIAGHKTSMLESWTKVSVKFEQRSRDAVSDRSRLARWTTTRNVDYEIKFIRGLRQLQRLTNNHSQGFVWEIPIEGFVVNLNFTSAGSQVNSGRCRFASPGSVILNFSHSYLPLIPLILF
jgi:hypothetical protein